MGLIYREILVLLAVTLAVRASSGRVISTKYSTEYEDYAVEDDDVAEDHAEDNCTRDCACVAMKGYRIATCNRLELGTQKFGHDITDLVVNNIDPRYPITLDDRIFKELGLHQITTIKIDNSTVSAVSPTAFHDLHELYAVTLTANRLSSLHPKTFAHNKELILLTLSDNPLKFPAKGSTEYFLNSRSVQELDISNCNMRYIAPNTFSHMRSLMYLNLAGNKLSSVDADVFRSLTDLNQLDLSDNDIMELPGDIFLGNTMLSTLHIQRNPIETVYALEIPDIVTLNAGQMKIKFVDSSMFNGMPYISNLNLSTNRIEKIHDQAFQKLIDLNYLDLSYNNLDFISSLLIENNTELDILKISNNQRLTQLPKNGFACSIEQFNIYLFDASNCGLEDISDKALSTFAGLTQINLSGNKLQIIGEHVFTHCTRLVNVNLANNLLTTLSRKVFAHNKEMMKLDLRGNPLKVMSSEVFIYTPKLTWLDMSQTALTSLWEEKGNHSAVLLNNLSFLNISNNNIEQIMQTEIESMDHLTTLDIRNNPLVCNCEFKSLMTWLNTHEVYYAVNNSLVAKEAPEELSHYSWESLVRKTCKTDVEKTYYLLTSTAAPTSGTTMHAGVHGRI